MKIENSLPECNLLWPFFFLRIPTTNHVFKIYWCSFGVCLANLVRQKHKDEPALIAKLEEEPECPRGLICWADRLAKIKNEVEANNWQPCWCFSFFFKDEMIKGVSITFHTFPALSFFSFLFFFTFQYNFNWKENLLPLQSVWKRS